MGRQTRGKTKPHRHLMWLKWLELRFNQSNEFCDRSIIDLGYGEKPYGVTELFDATRVFSPPPTIIGIESAEHRHRQAIALDHPEISFVFGTGDALAHCQPSPKIIRALNVLRQYPPEEVASIRTLWLQACPIDALLTEGTTDRDGDALAMWCQSRQEPRSLTFGVSGRRGFAPNQLMAVLPNDLRWLHPKPTWLERLFKEWTLAWARSEANFDPLKRFNLSIENLSQHRPSWVSDLPHLWDAGLVEFRVDHIVADTSN